MTEPVFIDAECLYQQVAGRISDRIERGELRPGDQLPAERVLAEQYGVAFATARRAQTAARGHTPRKRHVRLAWTAARRLTPTPGPRVDGVCPWAVGRVEREALGHVDVLQAGPVRAHEITTFDRIAQAFDDDAMARVYVELPHGWGPRQRVLTAWRVAGYQVDRLVCFGAGPDLMIFNGLVP